MHGSIHRNHCMKCGRFYTAEDLLTLPDIVPRCSCGGIIKPDVVLYEENLDDATVEGAIHEIAAADTLIVAGTSLTVYPAAGMVRYFGGEHLILINRSVTPMDAAADLVLREDVGRALEKIHLSDTPPNN